MCVHYDIEGIRVTSTELVVHGQHYRLSELDRLVIARGSHSRATTSCVTSACFFVVIAGYSWQSGAVPVAISAIITAIAVISGVAALISHRVQGRPYELWASYQHHTVQLLWSRDVRVFNQIQRAIWRARQSGPSRTHW